MKITVESTDLMVTLNGVPARIWQGETDSGMPVHVFVTRVAVDKDEDLSQFERELQRTAAPRADIAHAYPMRMLL